MARVRERGTLVQDLELMKARLEAQYVQTDLFVSAESLRKEVRTLEREIESRGLGLPALQGALADALAPYVVRRQRACIGESPDRTSGEFVYPA